MQIGGLSEGILSLGEQDNNRLRPVKAKGETHEKNLQVDVVDRGVADVCISVHD